MLFNARKIVLFVSGNSLTVAEVAPGKKVKVILNPAINWDKDSLSAVIDNIKKKFGSTIRLVVDDANVYLVGLKNPNRSDKESVGEIVSSIIPEDLRATEWGYYQQGEYIQVYAYHRELVEDFINPLRKAGFNIEHMEPLSLLISGGTNIKNSLIIYKRQHTDLIAADGKTVIAIHRIGNNDLQKSLVEFISFLNQKYQWSPSVVLCDGIAPDMCRLAGLENIEFKTQSVDAAIIIASALPMSDDSQPKKNNGKVITISVVAFLSVIMGGAWLAMNRLQLSSGETRRPSPTPIIIISTPVPTATPVATIEAVLRKDYVIEVLNGTGKAGAAGMLTKQLSDGGYEVAKTGNADSDGYDKTRMQYGLTVPRIVRDDLDKFLQDIYTEVIAEPKVASDGADITIIIGE